MFYITNNKGEIIPNFLTENAWNVFKKNSSINPNLN